MNDDLEHDYPGPDDDDLVKDAVLTVCKKPMSDEHEWKAARDKACRSIMRDKPRHATTDMWREMMEMAWDKGCLYAMERQTEELKQLNKVLTR